MKDTLSLIIGASNDTLVFAIKNAANIASDVKSNFLNSKEFWVAAFGLVGVLIGSVGTWYYKSKEIDAKISELKNQQVNLNLQSKLFEETKTNNINKMNAELIRLNDLSNQYELSLKKFNFDQLKEVLANADDKNEKVAMLKDFTSKLSKFNPEIPAWVDDYDDFKQIVVDHTYYRLEDIEKDIKDLLENHVTAFASLQNSFKKVSSQAAYLERQSVQYSMDIDDVQDEFIINKLFDSLFKLYLDYNNLIEMMQEEFRELDKMKRDFILGQSKKE